jgi:hypothetical protein
VGRGFSLDASSSIFWMSLMGALMDLPGLRSGNDGRGRRLAVQSPEIHPRGTMAAADLATHSHCSVFPGARGLGACRSALDRGRRGRQRVARQRRS